MSRLAVAVGAWAVACLPVLACVHASDEVVAAKVGGYAAELAACRVSALDAGHLDWDAYQACACGADKRIGVNTDSGCP